MRPPPHRQTSRRCFCKRLLAGKCKAMGLYLPQLIERLGPVQQIRQYGRAWQNDANRKARFIERGISFWQNENFSRPKQKQMKYLNISWAFNPWQVPGKKHIFPSRALSGLLWVLSHSKKKKQEIPKGLCFPLLWPQISLETEAVTLKFGSSVKQSHGEKAHETNNKTDFFFRTYIIVRQPWHNQTDSVTNPRELIHLNLNNLESRIQNVSGIFLWCWPLCTHFAWNRHYFHFKEQELG